MHRSPVPVVTAIVLLFLSSGPLYAQQNAVADFWLELESAAAPDQVARVEAPGTLSDELVQSLRGIRQYELTPSRRAAFQLRWDLNRALLRHRTDPEHQLALALLLRRGPDAAVRLDRGEAHTFIDPRSNASHETLRLLRRTLESQPELELAALELGRFALERHQRSLFAEADAALARVGQSAEVLLTRAELALERGTLTDALMHATAARLAGADPARVAHMRASALLLDPATEKMGAAAYLDGLEKPSPQALREYHARSALTFTLAEAAAWDALPDSARAEWLRSLWQLRAHRSGVSVAERLGVHYRRLYEAYRDFPLHAPLSEPDKMASMGILLGEDPRRHGLAPPGLALVRFGDASWFRWVGVCGTKGIPYLPANSTSMAGVLDAFLPPWGYRPVDEIDIMQHDDSQRMRALNCGNPTALRQFVQWIMSGERYRPRYDDQLDVLTEVYAFRGPAGADIIAGVTARRSDAQKLADVFGRVTLNTAVALFDTTTLRSERTERPFEFLLQQTAAAHIVLALEAQTTLTGPLEMRLTVEDPARRAGAVLGSEVEVPDFSGADLMLSDIVVGPTTGAAALRRGSAAFSVAAGRKYSRGETVLVYYEIYGLPVENAYRTRIIVAPQASLLWRSLQRLTGTEPDVITLQFDDRPEAAHQTYGVQEQRSIGTGTLRGGTYRLRIEITDLVTGAVAARDRLIDIE